MNEANISKRPRHLLANILILATTAILLIVVAFLWKAHMESRDQLQSLCVQNNRLQQELNVAKQEINKLNSGDSSQETRKRLAGNREKRPPQRVDDEVETLALQTPTVRQTPDGLVVHFEFKPAEGIEMPDDILLAVRVPMSSSSKLLSLVPVSAPDSAEIRTVINPAGYIGFIQGSPADLGTLAFEFTVSAPVKATVSGSDGIIDFEFDITPDGCTVTKL